MVGWLLLDLLSEGTLGRDGRDRFHHRGGLDQEWFGNFLSALRRYRDPKFGREFELENRAEVVFLRLE